MALYSAQLRSKLTKKTAVIGIIGIGYVGGALAEGSSLAGFQTIGFTRTQARADNTNKLNIPKYKATTDYSMIHECDVIVICVPTPIHEDKMPDLEPLISALGKTREYMKKGMLVIIESTIAPGTTRNIALPLLATSGFIPEKDFFLAFSPERVDPGNQKYGINNTPRVVSGLSAVATALTVKFYRQFVETVVPVSSLEVAEMSKILENTFRLVNISLINEMLEYTKALGVNMWEVIQASASKPYGFLPHYPGPGVGGHCIPVDPYYLLADARIRGVRLGILEEAGAINDNQPKKVVIKMLDIIKKTNGYKKNHTALLIGLSYKENVEDKRESPSLKIWELLKSNNIKVAYHDPYTPVYQDVYSEELTEEGIRGKDIIAIITPHSCVNYQKLVSYNRPILDTRNVLKDYYYPHIYRI